MLWFLIQLSSFRFSKRLKWPRVAGKRSRRPPVSVRKPGVSRTIPATKMSRASIRSSVGIFPFCRLDRTRNMACIPCIRARYAPIKPVKITSATVLNAPITAPTLMRRYISINGISVKAKKSLSSIGHELFLINYYLLRYKNMNAKRIAVKCFMEGPKQRRLKNETYKFCFCA